MYFNIPLLQISKNNFTINSTVKPSFYRHSMEFFNFRFDENTVTEILHDE